MKLAVVEHFYFLFEFLGSIPHSLLRRQKFKLEIAGFRSAKRKFAGNTPSACCRDSEFSGNFFIFKLGLIPNSLLCQFETSRFEKS